MKYKLAVIALLAGISGADAQSGDPDAGKATYASDCARCHRSAERTAGSIAGDTEAAKGDWLESFLPDHHLRDIGNMADLIAYLNSF
ncbi:hypothetical protein [Oricola sp.]